MASLEADVEAGSSGMHADMRATAVRGIGVPGMAMTVASVRRTTIATVMHRMPVRLDTAVMRRMAVDAVSGAVGR